MRIGEQIKFMKEPRRDWQKFIDEIIERNEMVDRIAELREVKIEKERKKRFSKYLPIKKVDFKKLKLKGGKS